MDSNLVSIVNGPSKFDLMLALFDSKFPDFRTVIFDLRDGRKFHANITGVEAEDGSSISWNFTGVGRFSTEHCKVPGEHVSGYYDTMRRTGNIKFQKGKPIISSEPTVTDRTAIINQSNKLVTELEQYMDDPRCLRVKLAAMAHALQMMLTRYSHHSIRKAVPHASALEVIMRAVAHGIEGKPEMESYIKQKLDTGYHQLLGELK